MRETPRKGSDTKERILDVAEAAVLEKGFAATSIEELIAAVDITKSGFFYHFKDKNEPPRLCSSAASSARTLCLTICSPVYPTRAQRLIRQEVVKVTATVESLLKESAKCHEETSQSR